MTPLQYLPLAALLVAAPVALSVAELTGENVCNKREMYTVTMRVVLKVPIQVKTYTWCFNFPPRCTNYKLEFREKFTIQAENRERIVNLCCTGYEPDLSGTRCIPVCKRGCLYGVCATPDACYCEPGYTGDRCDAVCQEGAWGPACAQQCRCQNKTSCNHVTGDCNCADGWRGALCDVTCPKGTYGPRCMKTCDCDQSGENSTCHHVTGKCGLPDHELSEFTSDYHESNTNHLTTVLPKIYTTDKPVETQNDRKSTDDYANSGGTVTTLQPTTNNISQTENIPFPITEKQVFSIDDKFPSTTAPTPTTTATTSMFTTIPPFTTTSTTILPLATEKEVIKQIPHEFLNSSVINITPLIDNKTNGLDSEADRKEIDQRDFQEEEEESATIRLEDAEQKTEEIGTTEPQNIQAPPRGIIVVSDGLLSERIEENESEKPGNGVWDLVSSASVAGGVALVLIVMAAVTLLVSHRRNKAKVTIAENEASDLRRQQLEQQKPAPGPQMYNYTDDVTTLPLRHLFSDNAFQPTNETPSPTEGQLPLSFGDVSGTMTTNNNLGHPYDAYNMRAYLELQYDIPPSSISSKSNSMLPGMEPEHLYDEIPCWRSITTTTTSTNTDTDTSRC